MSARTVFIYGRPGPHPLHRALVGAISSDLVPLDFLLRWYDVASASRARRYLSWLLCALFFPNRSTYDVFVADGILFIGNGPGEWRGWYKGLDLLLPAVARAAAALDELHLVVIGRWEMPYRERLLASCPEAGPLVRFVGPTEDLSPHLAGATLYVHLGRGEAFGVSILEAMCAGVPPLVSEWTGAREAVEAVDRRLVVPLDARRASEQIRWYFGLPPAERRALSARSREVGATYTEERGQTAFVTEFRRMLRHFDLPDLGPVLREVGEPAR